MSTTFATLGVSEALVKRLSARGIDAPFPIQEATLVDGLAGRDICGKAPTGSGKTLAFGIPLVSRRTKSKPRRPRALVLVPTRELAGQVRDELVALAGPGGQSVATFYGGVGFGGQLAALKAGVDIAVACPGRLADLVNRGAIRLDEVDMVVLDEADRMADMGFLPEVRRLLDQVRPNRQTLLFSATLDGDVDVLVKNYQRSPVRHELAAALDAPVSRQLFWRADRGDRVALTAQVVTAEWPAVVFCRTKRGADRLAKQLRQTGVDAEALHGDLSQNQRDRALASFISGKAQALIATDIAARGIHVDDVACVVHFDLPADEKDYVHRSGRTGRAGAAGLVVSLVPGEQVKDVRTLQRKLGLPLELDAPDVPGLRNGAARAPQARVRPDRPVERDRPSGPGSGSAPRRAVAAAGRGRPQAAPRGAGAGRSAATSRGATAGRPSGAAPSSRRGAPSGPRTSAPGGGRSRRTGR